jgi:hypothetical protein
MYCTKVSQREKIYLSKNGILLGTLEINGVPRGVTEGQVGLAFDFPQDVRILKTKDLYETGHQKQKKLPRRQ